MERVDIVIIGGGIAAWTFSYLLRQAQGIGKAIIVSSPDQHTASTHNQSWLQSGALYRLNEPASRQGAILCIQQGRKLLEPRNIRITERFGVMALANEVQAREKMEFIQQNGFSEYGAILSRVEVRRLLGLDFSQSEHFTGDTCFIKTPDQPFDEAELLRFFENSARGARFSFQSIRATAILKRNGQARNGYSIEANGIEYDPKQLFVMAGVNTLRFLMPLGIADRLPLKARRPVLMQVPLVTDLTADLFMDTVGELNVNTVANWRGERICLFGDSLSTDVIDLTQELTDRSITRQDKRRFMENFCRPVNYPHLRDRLSPYMDDNRRFSVCYKIETQGILPWIFDSSEIAPEFPNMYIAGSGKATLAYYVADKLMKLAKIPIQTESQTPRIVWPSSEIDMWFNQQMRQL
jgi:glycine/D-amino acid oxidase-like deaminating enzyme